MNPTARRLRVTLAGWNAFQPTAPAGYEMLGTVVEPGGVSGALARNRATGRLVVLNHGVSSDLRQPKAEAALKAAQNAGPTEAPQG